MSQPGSLRTNDSKCSRFDSHEPWYTIRSPSTMVMAYDSLCTSIPIHSRPFLAISRSCSL